MMKQLSVMLTGVLLFTACDPAPEDEPKNEPTANVRVLHLSPDAPNVDAFVNAGTKVVTNLAFGNSSAVIKAPVGRASLEVSATGSPAADAVVTLPEVVLEQNRDYSVVAFGKVANLALTALENSTSGLSTNNVRVRVVHAADGVGNVNVLQVPQTGAPATLAANLAYGTAAAPFDIPPAAITVGLDVNNDNAPDFSFEVPALPAGTYVNVFAALDGAGNPFLLAQLGGATVARLEALKTELRVLHLNSEVGAVNAYLDDVNVGALTFTNSSDFLETTAGTHTLKVGTSSLSPAITAPSLKFEGGTRYTAVAIGTASSPQALFFENGGKDLAAGNIRLRAIHAAPGVGEVDLYTLSDTGTATPLLQNVPYGTVSAVLDVPAGAYTVGVDTDNDARPELWFVFPSLAAGTIANLYVTKDNAGVFALAQLDGSTTARVEVAKSDVRVIHLSRTAPGVDVWVNGTKTVTDLAFGSTTAYLNVNSGAYDFAVTAAGAALNTAVINADGVLLAPGRKYTVAAIGDLGETGDIAIKPLLLEDDATGLAGTSIRLRVIHVATQVTSGDLYSVNKTTGALEVKLVDDFGFGGDQVLPDLPAAGYRVGFDAKVGGVVDGIVDVSFDLPTFAPATSANVYVINDAGGAVKLFIQTGGTAITTVDPL